MDANGLRFWLLADAAHWPSRAHTAWHAECGTLRLASERRLTAPVGSCGLRRRQHGARSHPARASTFTTAVARWNGGAGAIVVRSHLPGDALLLPLPEAPSDLCVGAERRAVSWRSPTACTCTTCAAAGPTRRCGSTDSRPGGSRRTAAVVWVLERAGRLARLTGVPLPLTTPQRDDYAPGVFRPDPENCCPPALHLLDSVSWPAGERPIALAAHPERGLAVLSWFDDGEARLRRLDADAGRLTEPLVLADARYAYALAWLDADRIAVRMPGRRDAPAFAVTDGTATALPLGEIYPLAAGAPDAPFAHRLTGPPRYPARRGRRAAAAALDQESRAPRQRRELRRHTRRPARAPARQRQCHDRLASSLRRGRNPARHAASSSGSPRQTRPNRRPRTATGGVARARLRARHRRARPRRDGPACPAGRVGAGGVGTARSPGPGAMDAGTRAARPVHGPDPERRRARAPARRPLPLGAGRAVRRRPRRAGHRGACARTRAASTTANTTCHGCIAKIVLGAAAESPGELVERIDAAHAAALDAGGTPSDAARRGARRPRAPGRRCRPFASSRPAAAGC